MIDGSEQRNHVRVGADFPEEEMVLIEIRTKWEVERVRVVEWLTEGETEERRDIEERRNKSTNEKETTQKRVWWSVVKVRKKVLS